MNKKVIGLARTIDTCSDGTLRVRLYSGSGLPDGAVLTGVIFRADTPPLKITPPLPGFSGSGLSGSELDTIARQNLHYNSHNPVVIK